MLSQAGPPVGGFQFGWELPQRLQEQPLAAVGLVAGLVVVVGASLWLYLRERASLSAPAVALLATLRVVAIAGVVIMLLGPQRRRVEQVVRPSRVAVLVDTSVSMAMPNEGAGSNAPTLTRSEAARRLLVESGLLAELAKTHTVSVAATDAVGKAVVFQPPAPPDKPSAGETPKPVQPGEAAEAAAGPPAAAYAEMLRPVAPQTRLGVAHRQAQEVFAGEPLAGIVLLSDGRNNAGAPPAAAAAAALKAGVPTLTVGFGATREGANLLVRELVAPSKAYPNDEIELTAIIESTGPASGQSTLSLFRRDASAEQSSAVLIESKPHTCSTSAGPQPVSFKVTPDKPGAFVYTLTASPLPGEARRDDNSREAAIEVVDRTTTVLLWAGGPSRDYRFLRDQLQRDDAFVVDVLLDSASPSASQDAREVLSEFPATAAALNAYDVVAAFDPDWSKLSEEQIDLVEAWISRRGGGLYYAPGAVNTPRWMQRNPSPRVMSWLPVELPDRLAMLGSFGATQAPPRAQPVSLTRSGAEAGFLWIAGSREASRAAWAGFEGFYRVNQTPAIRPGATVFANGEPGPGGRAGVIFAEQFYGGGRVFYSGVTELWRLRKDNPKQFASLTTKLLRRLAQGRLLSNAPGGSLLFERERYDLGGAMVLRAILPSPGGDAPPAAPPPVRLVLPGGEAVAVRLEASPSQRDAWTARLPADREGVYRAVLEPAEPLAVDGGDDTGAATPLTARTEVVAPQAERAFSTRDERLLREVARAGGGWYYPTVEAALDGLDETPRLADALASREEVRTLYGQPDEVFKKLISQALLGVICGALLVEWLLRRLMRVA
ncbi:MAG: hypothetical protein AAF790_10945 [Planctomycetota bacterium]